MSLRLCSNNITQLARRYSRPTHHLTYSIKTWQCKHSESHAVFMRCKVKWACNRHFWNLVHGASYRPKQLYPYRPPVSIWSLSGRSESSRRKSTIAAVHTVCGCHQFAALASTCRIWREGMCHVWKYCMKIMKWNTKILQNTSHQQKWTTTSLQTI